MQAIETEYMGPSSVRGARIRVRSQSKSITVPWDYALDQNENHNVAAFSLAERLSWVGKWAGGGSPNGKGNVYVCVDSDMGMHFFIGPI